MYVELLTVVPQVTKALLTSFLFVLFLLVSVWIVSTSVFSSLMIFSSILSNQLLIACISFYISDTVFFSSKSSI